MRACARVCMFGRLPFNTHMMLFQSSPVRTWNTVTKACRNVSKFDLGDSAPAHALDPIDSLYLTCGEPQLHIDVTRQHLGALNVHAHVCVCGRNQFWLLRFPSACDAPPVVEL